MKKIFQIQIALILSILLVGCSTFVPHTQKVSITVYEPDAELFVNGKRMESPAQFRAHRRTPLEIKVHKPGYQMVTKKVKTTVSATGIADIAGFFIFLFPGIGVLTPGAWQLEEREIYIPMFKLETQQHDSNRNNTDS